MLAQLSVRANDNGGGLGDKKGKEQEEDPRGS